MSRSILRRRQRTRVMRPEAASKAYSSSGETIPPRVATRFVTISRERFTASILCGAQSASKSETTRRKAGAGRKRKEGERKEGRKEGSKDGKQKERERYREWEGQKQAE